MPTPLWITILAVSLFLTPISVILNLRFSQGEKRFRGVIYPTVLALFVYPFFIWLWITYGAVAILMLFAMNLPLAASTVAYLVVRSKRYRLLFEEYKRQKKETRPAARTTARLNAALEGFGCATTLSDEALREVVILIKSGTALDKIAIIYDCPISELKHIERSFDRFRAEKEESKTGGEDYTVSPEQGEFFLQLMANATPKSLGCGEYLLWNTESVAELIRNATKIRPSRKSVADFLATVGLVPRESDIEITKTPEAMQWRETEYRKIRLSALENGAELIWVFAPTPASSRKYLILCAVKSNGSTSFGVYKGSGGFADFLNKLAQQTHAPVYAVVCTEYQRYKNLASLSADITLFTLGKNASIPDLAR